MKNPATEDEVLVSGDSKVGRLLKWLSGFTRRAVFRKDLSGIYFDEQCIVASDGFGVAAIPTPDTMKEHAGKLLDPRIPSWKTWRVMWPVIAAKFPNIRNALPKAGDQPILKTVFDAKLLAAALQGFQEKQTSDRVVRLAFYPIKDHKPHPNGTIDCLLVIQTQQAYVALMGMWGRSVDEKELFEPKPDVSLMAPKATVHAIDPGGTREKLLDPAKPDGGVDR